MNLKQAAQRLAVHYQTVYRWVRDGELSAVKVGNRYEVSDAAIDQFLSRRASLSNVPIEQPQIEVRPTAAEIDELGELRILARQTRTTAQPCFDAATALAGSRSGKPLFSDCLTMPVRGCMRSHRSLSLRRIAPLSLERWRQPAASIATLCTGPPRNDLAMFTWCITCLKMLSESCSATKPALLATAYT